MNQGETPFRGPVGREGRHTTESATGPATPSPLVGERILERIGIGKPYFDLQDLRFSRNTLLASAKASFAPTNERGPMQMAEVCRHASAAGASICAWRQKDSVRRYYLPVQVSLHGFVCNGVYGTPVDIAAEVLELNEASAKTAVKVTLGSAPLAELTVTYEIGKEADFQAAHAAHKRPVPPYVRPIWTLPQGAISREGIALTRAATVHPASCQGHLTGFPALPLPLVAGEFVTLAAQQVGGGFRCRELELEAQGPLWAGEKLKFSAVPAGRSDDTATFRSSVYRAQKRPVKAQLQLQVY